jgi:hypothetical protein
MFWVYADNKGNFVKAESLLLKKTKKITNASYWINKKQALTWQSSINRKFPNMTLKKAELILVD